MTFLNPLVLFGLAAAAIPLILHLLNLRKLRTIEFSTLAFLKELQQTKIRRLKLRQILLLLLRTLLLIFIVLAFARPALRGSFLGAFGGTQSHATIVVILDDSFSMEASDEHGERLRQAKEAAGKIVNLLREGDEAYLLKLSDLPKATIAPATHDAGLLRTAIGETQPSAVRRTATDALRLASQLLARSTNVNREIYLISDLQESLFPPFPQGEHPSFDARTRLFLVPIGRAAIQNAGVDSVEVLTTILERDKPAAVRIRVRNYGDAPLTSAILTATLDGTTAAQTNVSAAAGSAAAVELTVVPKRSGFIAGSVELEHDALDADNRRSFTMYIPERISVALAGTDDAENRFLLAALGAGGSDSAAAGGGLLDVRQIAAAKLPQLDLRHIDVLICSNLAGIAQSDAVRIRSFVEEGGGLVLFPGADPAAYNAALLPALGIPPVERTAESSAGLSWGHVDTDHPLFATVFEEDPLRRGAAHRNLESPVVRRMLRREAGRKARTIIALGDGSPFLTEHEAGRGKVLFYSVPPTLTWSDFPVKGLFAPLVYRSMIYASPKEHRERSFLAGDEPVVAIPNNAAAVQGAGRQFALLSPDGVEEILQPEAAAGAGFNAPLTFRLPRLAVPGVSRLHAGQTPLALYAVNVDGKESDTRPAAEADLARFWPSAGIPAASVAELRPGEEIQAAVLQSRFGIELWKYFIGLALLAALAEMIVARDSKAEAAA